MTIRNLEPWNFEQIRISGEGEQNQNNSQERQIDQNNENRRTNENIRREGSLHHFEVSLSRSESGSVTVLARSREDARRLAYELDSRGEIEYYNDDGADIYDVYEHTSREVTNGELQQIIGYEDDIYREALDIDDVQEYLYGGTGDSQRDQEPNNDDN